MVPVIKDIIRVPKEPPKALASKSSKRGRAPRSKSKQLDNENEDSREVVVYNPEEGWDDKTDPHGIVLDYISQLEVKRRAFV
jgi:centromere protein C